MTAAEAQPAPVLHRTRWGGSYEPDMRHGSMWAAGRVQIDDDGVLQLGSSVLHVGARAARDGYLCSVDPEGWGLWVDAWPPPELALYLRQPAGSFEWERAVDPLVQPARQADERKLS